MGVTFWSTVNAEYSGVDRMQVGQRYTMVDESDNSIGPAFLDFFEQYLCVGPRNRQAGNRWNTLPKCAIRILVRGEAWGHGIPRVHGDELD